MRYFVAVALSGGIGAWLIWWLLPTVLPTLLRLLAVLLVLAVLWYFARRGRRQREEFRKHH